MSSTDATSHSPNLSIIPPNILEGLSQSPNIEEDQRTGAEQDLQRLQENLDTHDQITRGRIGSTLPISDTGTCAVNIHILTYPNPLMVKQLQVRPIGDNDAPTKDETVNTAYDHAQLVLQFYEEVLGTRSIDDRCHDINVTVHYDLPQYDRAFWNTDLEQLFLGDSDGMVFGSFVALDVVAHEIDHGHTQYQTGLSPFLDSGALNEHKSDVTAVTVVQWAKKQKATPDAHWTIGAETMLDVLDVNGHQVAYTSPDHYVCAEGELNPDLVHFAMRSFKNEKAYENHPIIPAPHNEDTQPKHMDGYIRQAPTKDLGAVHTNSGIPNHAYYLAATAIGGNAWESTYQVWSRAFLRCTASTNFRRFAEYTIEEALAMSQQEGSPIDSKDVESIATAWQKVGVLTQADTQTLIQP